MKVIIYTTPWCNICHSVMDWFEKIGVEYEERNAADDMIREEANAKLGKDFVSAPVIVIGDDVISGFSRPEILQALEKYGLKK